MPFADTPARPSALDRHATLVVFLAALAWFGALAWLRPLSLPDEGRYVGVAWEMFRSGNWVTPTLDGLPFFHKPPLFYWITAAAMHLFGPGEWAARSAPLSAGATTIAVLYSVCREWLGESIARKAALVLATLPLFYGGSQFANMDMLVAACISVTILLAARAALRFEAGTSGRDDLVGPYVAAALGVLAKGLIGLVIPALVLLVWLGLVRHGRTIRALMWVPGIAILAVIVAPWFVAVEWEHPAFFHYFFVVQQFQRFTGAGFNNVQPVWFYAGVLALFGLPWTLWLLAHFRRAPTLPSPRPAVLSLMWVWLGVVLVFFSIPQSKPIGYALPALPALAVLLALTAEPLCRRSGTARSLWRLCAGIAAAICVAMAIGYAMVHPKSSRELAIALAAHRAPGEGLAFIDEYRYDVPFYARDTSPVFVVSNWDPADVAQHDNWRKELADAGRFAGAAAADRLLDEAAFRSALCSGRIRWIIAGADREGPHPFLDAASRVATAGRDTLWHIDPSDPRLAGALGCAGPTGRAAPAR